MIEFQKHFDCCVSTTVRLYHLDAQKTPGEKVRWKLYKNSACCLRQILMAAPNKIAAV